MGTVKRVGIYVRISADAEDRGEGVERQEQDCRKRAAREGWEVVNIYPDNDISASTLSKKPRKQWNQLVADVEAGKVDVILGYSNSRLTRRPMELEDLIRLHERTGVRLATIVSGDSDLSTADGRAIARTLAAWDAAEAERTSERRKRESASKRAQGMHQGRRPFGWRDYKIAKDEGGRPVRIMTLDEAEGPALAKAIQDILRGISITSIAREWNTDDPEKDKKSLRTTSGKSWDLTNLRLVLCRYRNAGVVEHQGKPMEGVEGRWEPVCTKDDLEKARALLMAPERRTRVGLNSTTLLSSVAKCGKCGRPMISGAQRKSRKEPGSIMRTYRCQGALGHHADKCYVTIKADVLDKMVTDAVRLRLVMGGVGKLLPTPQEKELVHDLRKERLQIASEESELATLMGQRLLSPSAARGALQGLSQRRDEIDATITSITSRFPLESLFEERAKNGSVISWDRAAEVSKEFKSLDLGQRREIVRALFSVQVNPGRDAAERVVISRL